MRNSEPSDAFGPLLKQWRAIRRMSQLDLALAANVSARHVSFLETGRAAPSRAMVLQLSETLEAPRAARNALLQAAGFAPAYRARDLGAEELAVAREALGWTLSRHAPYPAFAIDRHWRLVDANPPALALLGAMGATVGDSLIELFLSPGFRAVVENWEEVAGAAAARLRAESAHFGGDATLDAAEARLRATLGEPKDAPPRSFPALIPARYRLDGRAYAMTSVIAQFGSVEDVMLADLKIELLYPADAQTRALFEAGASAGAPAQ